MAKVYLDPGHGGADNGAVKYVTEDKVNLEMALACRDYLEMHGVVVKMSRTKDVATSLSGLCAEANKWGADLAVSIHNNGGGGDGFEIYHHYGGGKGKTLAANIEAEVKKIGQNSRGLKTRRDTDGTDYYGFIRLTDMPAVICEGAFVDNKKDAAQIDTKAEQRQFGIAYAKGILKTLGIKEKKTEEKKETVKKTIKYKVRKSWDDVASQQGAYHELENAIKKCNELRAKGYKVYDLKGDVVYRPTEKTNDEKAKEIVAGLKAAGYKVKDVINSMNKLV